MTKAYCEDTCGSTRAMQEGLQVVSPKINPSKLDEAWSDECTNLIYVCGPGKKTVVTTLGKRSTVKHDDISENIQTTKAKVETHYRQESHNTVMEKSKEP